MYWMQKNRMLVSCASLACVLIMFAAAEVQAGDDIAGEWVFKMNFGDQEVTANACFTKNEDGTYTGTWKPNMPRPEDMPEGEMPEMKIELADIKFENNKLTFIQKGTINEEPFEVSYSGELKEGKIEGNFTGEWGENPAAATRLVKVNKCPIGDWDIMVKSGDKQTKAKLCVCGKEDGTYTASLADAPEGDVISEVKCEDGNLCFVRKCKMEDKEVTMNFDGMVENNKLTGKFTTDAGQMEVTGMRIMPSIAGKWEITTTSERGERTSVLTIKDDMTGTYQMRDEDVPVKDLKYDQGQLSFKVEMNFGDNPFVMEFKGKVDGTSIDGEFTTPRGARKATGKKVVEQAQSEQPPVAAAAEPSEN